MATSSLARPCKRFIVKKDNRNNRWGVYDTRLDQWCVWPRTKKQALDTAEDWNLVEDMVAARRRSFRLILGGVA